MFQIKCPRCSFWLWSKEKKVTCPRCAHKFEPTAKDRAKKIEPVEPPAPKRVTLPAPKTPPLPAPALLSPVQPEPADPKGAKGTEGAAAEPPELVVKPQVKAKAKSKKKKRR